MISQLGLRASAGRLPLLLSRARGNSSVAVAGEASAPPRLQGTTLTAGLEGVGSRSWSAALLTPVQLSEASSASQPVLAVDVLPQASTPRSPWAVGCVMPLVPILEPEAASVADVDCPSGRSSADMAEPTTALQVPVSEAPSAPSDDMHCGGTSWRPRRQRNIRLHERWWLEYDPPKNFYISGFGRGPHGGFSIKKQDWPRQMLPIRFRYNKMRRDAMRHSFRKQGFEYDTPKWGG